MPADDPLLALDISVDYAGKKGVLRNIGLAIRGGEVLGLVGQSGAGKSTISLAILRLLGGDARVNGKILFHGQDLLRLSEPQMRTVRGRQISLVLQSPLASLNPVLRIGTQLTEAWRAHANGSHEKLRKYLHELLAMVSLPPEDSFLRCYPRQLSVGLAQRVLIAMAILHRPPLLIADEPTSALDGITASEILQLFVRLNQKLQMAILYISHDLLSIASLCHRVAILHEGEIVECARTEEIFRNPAHPYTRRLIEALPRNCFSTSTGADLYPSLFVPPVGGLGRKSGPMWSDGRASTHNIATPATDTI